MAKAKPTTPQETPATTENNVVSEEKQYIPKAHFKNISRRVLMLKGKDRILPDQEFDYEDTLQMQRLVDRKILARAQRHIVYDDEGNVLSDLWIFQ